MTHHFLVRKNEAFNLQEKYRAKPHELVVVDLFPSGVSPPVLNDTPWIGPRGLIHGFF
jgi:hypothetical protein